ncbi:hypothetical protein ILP86_04690 [Microbacterium sp. R1]|uniref:Head-to-tail stopper n=1 Tax=Microbacterium phage vB_MoxS-R1 TaxID=2848881 RepID=A0A8F2IV93_9CAUD|nr:hypothetical protein [Microbacterium sp. R1]YP_010649931.1 head closure Hc1 [Microbacterium phage vB_MoxS-R1]MBE7953616.1 hypothetical protein [Microbacterium sp. R1]QWT28901.1 hypothetical protein vBMoxSR1_gp51 [Microbacterium phage vB_MoxS-R1]
MRPISEFVDHEAFEAGAVDATGNAVEAWLPAVTVGVYAFDPGSSSEPREGNDRVIVEPTLYMPFSVVLGHRDVVWARGKRYEVEGETREWVHPTDPTRRANVATLRRVDG